MSLYNKQLESIDIYDLDALVANKDSETKRIEYKSQVGNTSFDCPFKYSETPLACLANESR